MTATPAKREARAAVDRLALKENDQFLVADASGDIDDASDGLFLADTRVLSRLTLDIGGRRPALLSAGVSHDNVLFRAHLTNERLPELGGDTAPGGVIHIERIMLLWDRRLYEQITLTNYGDQVVAVPVGLRFAVDFHDIFEVRGWRRDHRGRLYEPEFSALGLSFKYEGLDALVRFSTIAFSQPPDRLTHQAARFDLSLPQHASLCLYLEVGPAAKDLPDRRRFRHAAARARIAMRGKQRQGARVGSPGNPFQGWLAKARADIALLTTEFPSGPYPCAGIPWFSTTFGRDGIVTALQTLWFDPSLARGVLRFLAEHQAREFSAPQDAAPGKILHEMRQGEMSALGEVPFGRYYGSVDSTPLFVMLAGAYAQRTDDVAFIDEIWPHLVSAMAWIDGDGDTNGDGFVDYARARASGLANQGWKDSGDAVFHADGRVPTGPVALVEVQGYAYAARKAMAWLAKQRGDDSAAQRWRQRAEGLRSAVERHFWMADERFYAMALDGDGRQCAVLTSNAGQLLYSRLPSPRRAELVIRRLLSASFDSGWGIRTLAQDQPRFNPMSYHNGSIWPHDTALCAAGMAQYGNKAAAAHFLSELFAAALQFDLRLPELFCGFPRRLGEPPVAYPVACLPQAWSSGAPFMLLQACLGIRIDARMRTVHVDRPELPAELDRLLVQHLPVADRCVDLCFERHEGRVIARSLGKASNGVQILMRH